MLVVVIVHSSSTWENHLHFLTKHTGALWGKRGGTPPLPKGRNLWLRSSSLLMCYTLPKKAFVWDYWSLNNTYCCDWSDQWKKRREIGPQILFLKIHHICATQVPLPTKWDLIDQLMEAKPPNTCPAVSCTTINTGPWLVIWWMNELKLSPWIWVENRSLHWCCSDTGR